MAENKIDIDRFVQLSNVLTGAPKLDPTLAEAYLGRLRAEYASQVTDVLTAFAAIEKDEHLVFEVKRRIVEDKALGALAQKIIAIWYTSEFVGADGKPKTGKQAEFYSGLLWQVIRAHAPTNSKLNYGDWKNPP
jgi:hypothetical protein